MLPPMRGPHQSSRHHLFVLVTALVASSACRPSPPGAEEAHQYAKQLSPLLYENGLLAQRIFESASEISQGQAKVDAFETRWRASITPLAEHLVDQAEALTVPTPWRDRHDGLVAIWGVRAEGYRAVSLALERGDKASWRAGRDLADDSKVREERWFIETNRAMKPLGVVLDQIP